jgi:hypothetical protein
VRDRLPAEHPEHSHLGAFLSAHREERQGVWHERAAMRFDGAFPKNAEELKTATAKPLGAERLSILRRTSGSDLAAVLNETQGFAAALQADTESGFSGVPSGFAKIKSRSTR